MIRLNFAEDDFEELKKRSLDSPQQAIESILLQLDSSLSAQFYSKAYYLLSILYNTFNDNENSLYYINKAIELATIPEDKIISLVRRGAFFIDTAQSIRAFQDLTLASEICNKNKKIHVDCILSLKLTLVYLIRTTKMLHLLNPLFEEIDALIPQSKNQYMIAHYYKAKGVYYFAIKKYSLVIVSFDKAVEHFRSIHLSHEIVLLNQHYALTKFLINDSTYLEHRSLYEAYLKSKNSSLLNLRYLISIVANQINPFSFSNISIPEYLKAIKECADANDNKSVSLLYLFLHKHYESLGDFKQTIYYFEKYSDFALVDMKDKEASYLIEDKILFELQKQLNYPEENLTNINRAKKTIYQNYISTNISQNFAKEINPLNYEIISNLIVEQFKTQVSICTNYGIKFLETNNIQVLESDGNYTILYDKDAKRHISSKPLAYYEKQLDPKSFLRTHRSYIININYIVHFFPGRVGKIELTNGQIIEVSARKMAEVRRRILN